MAEDDERREGSKRSNRRDPARNVRRDAPIIDGRADDLTPPVEPIAASGEMMEAPPVEAEHPEAVRAPDHEQVGATSDPTPVLEETHAAAETTALPHPSEPMSEAASPTSYSPTRASHATEPSRSLWGVLAALGFVVLAAGILYLFHVLSLLPPDNSAAIADLNSRVAAIQSRPAADVGGLSDRVAKIEQTTRGMQSAVDALTGTVSGLGDIGRQTAELRTEVTALKTDLDGVKSSVAALPRPDIGRLEARIGDLDQRFGTLQSAVSNIPHVDLGPVTGKLDALESRFKPIETEVAKSLSAEQVAQRRAAPIAVTAQSIAAAIDTGAPFPQQLQALETFGTDPAKIAPLRQVAQNGAPSLAELQASLAALRERIVTEGAVPASGSYLDRLVSGASSLVQVRPLGSVVGNTPSAIVSRMNEAIGNDDLAAAVADWHKLPEASQASSKALADRIKLRLDAEQAAKTIAAEAIAAMAAPHG